MMSSKVKVHFVGTHGVPAKYGGFETLVDFLCKYLSDQVDCTVYCSAKKYTEKNKKYYNASLIYLPLSASGFQGIFYDVITLMRSFLKADVIVYLSPVGSGFFSFMNVFFRKKFIINHGGLNEWEREKLSYFERVYAKFNHKIAARFATVNIADNNLYKESLKANFGADSVVIRYGGDHVVKVDKENNPELIEKYPFVNEKYAVSVSRAQIDNNLHLVLEAFEEFDSYKLVLVSNWEVSAYGKDLYEKYKDHPNIILLDAIYDKKSLDFVRGNANLYIHTHSRCGTAPSLVEAMNLGKAIISFDVPTNRETTQNKAMYFTTVQDLKNILNNTNDDEINRNGEIMFDIARKNYTWDIVSSQYLNLIK